MLTIEHFGPIPTASSVSISTEEDCRDKLANYNSCEVMFPKDGEIKKEIQGLIDNLILRCLEDENACHLSEPACPPEIEDLSSWNKTVAFVHQIIEACLHIMQHVCPEDS